MRKIIVFLTVLLLAVSLGAAAGDRAQQLDDRKQINIFEDEKQDDTVRGNVALESVKGSIEGVGKKKIKKDKVTTFIVDYDGDNTPIIKGSALVIPDDQAEKIGTVGEAIEYIEKNAKSAREGGKHVGNGQVIVIIDEGDTDGDGIGDVVAELAKDYDGKAVIGKVDVDNNPGTDNKRSARKGRNPQTGKEIKIPARDGDHDGSPKGLTIALAMEGKVKFFNEEKGYASIKDKESGEEYFVHATGHIDEIRDEDDVSSELREGRKGMNAVDVRRAD